MKKVLLIGLAFFCMLVTTNAEEGRKSGWVHQPVFNSKGIPVRYVMVPGEETATPLLSSTIQADRSDDGVKGMVAEMVDSVTPRLMLYTMDKKYQPIDQLTIYEKKDNDRTDDYGETYMEYYITSKYEIMLLLYYQSHHQDQKPELLNSRRFVINKDGQFEETIIEL